MIHSMQVRDTTDDKPITHTEECWIEDKSPNRLNLEEVTEMRFNLSLLEQYVYMAMCKDFPCILETSKLKDEKLEITDPYRYCSIVKTYWRDILNYESEKENAKIG